MIDILNGAFFDRVPAASAAYRLAIESALGGLVGAFELRGGARSPAQTINQWVSRETQGRIKSLGGIEDFDEAGLVLVNAIFLTQFWDNFGHARPAPFHLRLGNTVRVPTLSDESHAWPFLATPGFTVAELGFFSEGEALDVFLPGPGDVTTLVAGLTPALVQTSLAGLEGAHLRLSLPKFETRRSLDLIPILQRLGITLPFEDAASFPGITSTPVHLVKLTQDVRIKVDEQGVRASAVTLGAFDLGMSGGPPHHNFIADHPFVILIRDLPTGAILFIGVINNPLLKE